MFVLIYYIYTRGSATRDLSAHTTALTADSRIANLFLIHLFAETHTVIYINNKFQFLEFKSILRTLNCVWMDSPADRLIVYNLLFTFLCSNLVDSLVLVKIPNLQLFSYSYFKKLFALRNEFKFKLIIVNVFIQ